MRKLPAGLAGVALALLGLPATLAAAGVPAAGASTLTPRSLHAARINAAPVAGARLGTRAAAASISSNRVADALQGPAPACYGDVRSMPAASGVLQPASFGAFYNCAQSEWTFEVTTTQNFSAAQFGAWYVNFDIDGGLSACTNAPEYEAAVYQTSPGHYAGSVGSINPADGCQFEQTGTASIALAPNAVSLTFAASAVAGTTINWLGVLDNPSQWANNGVGNVVPASNFDEGGVDGYVWDSVPPSANPPSACAAPASPSSTNVATTTNSADAAAALRRAGLGDVHDYGEGVVSFTGSAASARAALGAAGLSSQVNPEHTRTVQSTTVAATGTTTAPNDPGYPSQWNLAAIGAPGAWSVTTGNEVVVADIDTGVDFGQSDLATPQLTTGIDETTSPPSTLTYSSGNTDGVGHGTAVAGVIAAATNNATDLASLGWNTRVMPVKVSTDGTLTTAAIAAGIDYAVSNGARIINLSFGGPCPDSTEEAAVENAISSGVLVVAAAGNGALSPSVDPADGYNDDYTYPAAYPGVIAVGATAADGTRALYSNTGPYVSLMAPGGGEDNSTDCIPVLSNSGGTDCEAGTSFSAPEVAAAAALIWSANSTLTAEQVRELLVSTATDAGPSGTDIEYGAGVLNASVALADTPSTRSGYGTYTPLPPARILDTRTALGGHPGRLGPASTITLPVTGVGGVPATGVAAVVLNVTETGPTASSFLDVYPAGQTQPNSSNLNFLPTATVPNLVTVKVGAGGAVNIYNNAGSTFVIVDVQGYYGDGTSGSPGSTYVPLAPVRLLDTRTNRSPLGPAGVRSLPVAGVGPVPSTAAAVVLNVTVTHGTAPTSYLTVFPDGTTPPNASNLNFHAAQTVPNLVTVKVGADGSVDFYNNLGTTDLVVDLEGYFTAPGSTAGSRFFPVVDHRILDTRFNIGGFFQPIPRGTAITLPVVGQGGIVQGATGVVMNVTVTSPSANGYITLYPSGSPPNASNLNFLATQTVANLVSTDLSASGTVQVYNSTGPLNAIADVEGWYGPAGQ